MSEHEEKRSLLAQLIKLAKSDKNVKASELNFLSEIAKQMDFPMNEFDELFTTHIDFDPPQLELDRIVQFHRLVLLMSVDQHVNEKELQMVRNLGMRMGLNPLAVAEVLDIMHDQPNQVIAPDKLISIFRTFHN